MSFNSRTLGRVRPVPAPKHREHGSFQFTHPGKGATFKPSDVTRFSRSFNSRTLGRVRLISSNDFFLPAMFQFTHPGKGATGWCNGRFCVHKFQFTHPGKGATSVINFCLPLPVVSIHAPWEGCDDECEYIFIGEVSFNSRTLGRVRPNCGYPEFGDIPVSIHAPWEGCDLIFLNSQSWITSCFNSRTLGRVRRGTFVVDNPHHISFNSRTLGRVRLHR